MKIKKACTQALLSIMLLLIVCGSAQPAYAVQSENQPVKIAYFNMGDYYGKSSEGQVISYDADALALISKYSGLTFEYVDCGTWANALTMLKNHEVDLVGTVQWTKEREAEYEFCLQNYGYTVGELAALPQSNYVYEDYARIGQSVVGCTKDYVRMAEMQAALDEHGISPIIKTYDGQTELENALNSGEIDLIAANSHTLQKNLTIVEKFSYTPFYLMSWKGNDQLTDQIDDALIALNLNDPSADDDLLRTYFPTIIGTPLTKQEQDLIAEGNTYTIYYDTATKPLVWYDETEKVMKGVLVEACRQISENTGLKIQVLPRTQAPAQPDDTVIQYTTLFEGSIMDSAGDLGVTDALINEDFNLYYSTNHKVDLLNDSCQIAIVKNRDLLASYIQTLYPNATVCEYDTPLACLKAVESGKTGLAYLDVRVASSTLMEAGITDVREYPVDSVQHGIGMMFTGKNSELLASIVNKGIGQLDKEALSNQLVDFSLGVKEAVTWKTLLRDRPQWVLLIAALFLAVFVAIAVLITYARVMKKQNDKVVKADISKTEFFSRMSHDMRTPMNGILGMIALTEDTDDLAEIRSNMGKAKSAGEYMLSLINDTLDLQRIESNRLKLELQAVEVKRYYDSIFSILKVSAQRKQIDFRVRYVGIDLENYILVDPVRLKQILSNLISNAIKFTPNGGTVEITVESLGEAGDVLHRRYTVRDTGIGMSEDFIANRLYKPYSQENNAMTSDQAGSGLGMAITKNLVTLMGGHMDVESTLGEGTTFTVYLDIRRALKEQVQEQQVFEKQQEEKVVATLDGKRILLCEDHPLNAEIAIKLLEKVGCKVNWAENGQLGVDLFAQSKAGAFDAILMDIRMPVMDGIDATRQIRTLQREDAANVPIIAMTANAYDSDVKNCLDAGMNAHLAKPIDPHRMYATLYEFIKT